MKKRLTLKVQFKSFFHAIENIVENLAKNVHPRIVFVDW